MKKQVIHLDNLTYAEMDAYMKAQYEQLDRLRSWEALGIRSQQRELKARIAECQNNIRILSDAMTPKEIKEMSDDEILKALLG